jgi:hypothetical protein
MRTQFSFLSTGCSNKVPSWKQRENPHQTQNLQGLLSLHNSVLYKLSSPRNFVAATGIN